jgi:MoaA/NifB/PqqE/SkfB family radical SAM enzyme
LKTARLNEIIQEAGTVGFGIISLTGGEPFLHPQIDTILDTIRQQKALFCHILSNGTMIDSVEADHLKQIQANIQISIDGPENYHDDFRGMKGAFQRTSHGLNQLIKADVSFSVLTTITRINLPLLPEFIQWLVQTGVKRIFIQPLLGQGRGNAIQELRLNDEQICDLFMQVSDLAAEYRSSGVEFTFSGYKTKALLETHPCAAYVCNGLLCHRKVTQEVKKLIIREDGTVLPEIATLDPRYSLGNIQDASLRELILEYFLNGGYKKFDELCRNTYNEIMPVWKAPLIPWDEIVSERSQYQ